MRFLFYIIMFLWVFQMGPGFSFSNTAIAKKNNPIENGEDQLMQRIDFGNSYIMGQTIKSGAVYLLQRKKSEIKSMLKVRENYREEILDEFYIRPGEVEIYETNKR